MAPHTRTRTVTTTWTRINLLVRQVNIVLRRTTNTDKNSLKEIFERGLREKIIGKITVYGVDDLGLCHAEIRIMIDWEKYQIHIREGRENVTTDSRWVEGTSLEVDELTRDFNEYVCEKSLRTFWRVAYAPRVDVRKANKILGLSSADHVKWKNGKKGGQLWHIEDLDEMSVGAYYVNDN